MKLKPSLKVEEVSQDYIFISDSEEGKTERVFKHPSQMQYFAKLEDTINRIKMERDRDNAVLKSTIQALGIETNNSYTNMALLCSTLLGAKIILDDEEYVTIGSTNGYISGSLDIKNVLKKSYVDSFQNLFDGFHRFIDGEISVDEERKAEYVDTLQGG